MVQTVNCTFIGASICTQRVQHFVLYRPAEVQKELFIKHLNLLLLCNWHAVLGRSELCNEGPDEEMMCNRFCFQSHNSCSFL